MNNKQLIDEQIERSTDIKVEAAYCRTAYEDVGTIILTSQKKYGINQYGKPARRYILVDIEEFMAIAKFCVDFLSDIIKEQKEKEGNANNS